MDKDYDVVAAIYGKGDVEIEAAEALLDWSLPEKCLVEITGKIHPGLSKIHQWCEDLSNEDDVLLEYSVIDYEDLGSLISWQDQDYNVVLIVLGIEGSEKIIQDAWNYGIEVYDLTRALFAVTKDDSMALYEPETQPHEISDGLGGRGPLDIFAPQNASESVTEASPHDYILIEEMKKTMIGIVKAHEEKYHATDTMMRSWAVADPERTDTDSGQAGGSSDRTIRGLRNQDGVIRISPRAKAKANETVVWLTQEEASNI